MPMPILKVALPVPLPELFDYKRPEDGAEPRPGCRVVVPFGRRKLVGVVVAEAASSSLPGDRLQTVDAVPDEGEVLLSEEVLQLLQWSWRYYKHAPGPVVLGALPPRLRSARNGLYDPPEPPPQKTPEAGPKLTSEQETAVQAMVAAGSGFSAHLLDGITGSGKTEVYIHLIEAALAAGRQVLILVPEIGLTPQLLSRLERRLGIEPAVIHSGLTPKARLLAWDAARRATARLLVGTRSALFTPLPDLGLIILDEEHDPSFKQQEGFRFSARDIAVKRAADLQIPVVLGSATPSLESLHNARSGRYQHHRLRRRATQSSLPRWRIQDLRDQPLDHGLSPASMQAIAERLDKGEQVMVFLNRRGWSPVLLCHSCGWHARCERCDANMTWHRADRRLCCHHCGARRAAPDLCPDCRADGLHGAGEGTQQLEEALEKAFPDYSVLRFDRDSTRRKGVMDSHFDQVLGGSPCVLVGTQMLAKGHHFPAVTLVIIVNIDQSLYSADYRALERMGQMMTQVAGRAGREDRPGEVILQTLHPDHAAFELLIARGYEAYAEWMLEERGQARLPPFTSQALLRADAHQRAAAERFLNRALECFPRGRAHAFGPVPAIMERLGGRSRMYLVIDAATRQELQASLDGWLPLLRGLPEGRKVRWGLDVDPQEF